jgi:4-hydroxy-3-polyprenylbenzoate decarboxylase
VTEPGPETPVVVAITGASGAVYGQRLLAVLRERRLPVELILTGAGRRVWQHERPEPPPVTEEGVLHVREPDDIGAAIASGSCPTRGMAIVPCSMGSLARVAAGLASNLVERAADVTLKERRPLVVVPREMPYTRIQLENMLRLHDAGAVILPASPSFYGRPAGLADLVDSVVGRVLEHLGLEAGTIGPRWTGDDRS